MARRDDLEQSIRESYSIIRDYEAVIRTSNRPEEKIRAKQAIEEQWSLVKDHLPEYRNLVGDSLPDDVAQILARFSSLSDLLELEKAIAAQEALRDVLPEEQLRAALAALEQKKTVIETRLWGGTQARAAKARMLFIAASMMVAALALIGGAYIVVRLIRSKATESHILVRVANPLGASVSGANVMLFYEGVPPSKYSDANGVATFQIDHSGSVDVRLIVETEQYEIYERELQLPRDTRVEVRLKERSADRSSFVVRVVDERGGNPAAGAEISLQIEGRIYSEAADPNGIAKFTIALSYDEISAQMSVTARDYDVEPQRVKLLANRLQDVKVDPGAGTLKVEGYRTPSAPEAAVSLPEPSIEFGHTVSDTLAIPGDTELYSFLAGSEDVVLLSMGRTSGSLYPKLQLYDPEHNLLDTISGTMSVEMTAALAVEGIYSILASDGRTGMETGKYGLSLQLLSSPTNVPVLVPGQSASGSIDISGQADAYAFVAGTGDTVVVTMGRASGTIYPGLRLYGPKGDLLRTHTGTTFAEVKAALPADGVYTILVNDSRTGAQTGAYGLSYQRLP
jgi:hypothetical protein